MIIPPPCSDRTVASANPTQHGRSHAGQVPDTGAHTAGSLSGHTIDRPPGHTHRTRVQTVAPRTDASVHRFDCVVNARFPPPPHSGDLPQGPGPTRTERRMGCRLQPPTHPPLPRTWLSTAGQVTRARTRPRGGGVCTGGPVACSTHLSEHGVHSIEAQWRARDTLEREVHAGGGPAGTPRRLPRLPPAHASTQVEMAHSDLAWKSPTPSWLASG